MPGVSEEQITAARQMTAIEFFQRYRPGELVKAESRGEFQLRAHDSFKINEAGMLAARPPSTISLRWKG